ncbi:MAG TPA: TetR/AcrR family transcriptional regulator [Streptosporangiaceae bacterium]|nr:TetR/AcrR family transcriptional regulator [Streptosporangiaceae bacterium]
MSVEFEPPPDDRLPIGGTPVQCRLAAAAIDLFYAQGALGTTVRQITGACGLTPGALYNHFTSKEHLLYLLIRDIHLGVDREMASTIATAGPGPAEQLGATVRVLVAHTADYKKRSRVANREFTLLTGPRREEVRAIRRSIRDRLTGVLMEGAEQGTFNLAGGNDRAAATLASATISNMCVHISEWMIENYPIGTPDLQDRYVFMALRIAGADKLNGPAGRQSLLA